MRSSTHRAADIVTAAAAYLGSPWKHQGRARHGLDCLGLIILAAVDVGLARAAEYLSLEARQYGRMPPNALARELLAVGMIRTGAPVPGAVGLFAQAGTYPSHVGIIAGEPGAPLEVIHASALAGKVVRHILVPTDPNMLLRGCFLYPGVDY